ncbi:hypothetical protein PM082_011531 [Marasmius tenuissimus]|nr:hypothetical protein PM082_011531 [Marasmius tenuissimus]
MIPTAHSSTTYIPLSSLAGWSDYREKIFPDFDYATSFTARAIETFHPDPVAPVRLLATESTCLPLSIIAALEDVIPNLSTHIDLCIHIIGADMRELAGKGMLEELLHFLPNLQRVMLFFVGPKVVDHGRDTGRNVACERCMSAGRVRSCVYYTGTYHDFKRTRRASARVNWPHLIVGLNTGMSEVDTDSWKKTLRVIRDMGVPTLFTTCTKKEGEAETELMRSMGIMVREGLEMNKWKGVVPRTNNYWNTDADGPIASYNSYYRYVVQGRA